MARAKGTSTNWVTPELKHKIREGDHTRFNQRTPVDGSVIRQKIGAKAVGANELSSSDTNDAERSVGSAHAKTNFLIKRHVPNNLIDSDLLLSSATDDALRAITSAHAKTDFLIKRHVPNNLIDGAMVSSSTTDDTLRAIRSSHQQTNSTTRRVLSGSDTDDTVRAVSGTHMRDGLLAARHFPAGIAGAWVTPTLLNGWINFGSSHEVAGYRKTPWGEVWVRGLIAGGTTTDGTVVLTLPTGYRPAKDRHFATPQGNNTACRIVARANGNVDVQGCTNNTFLSLESIRFDAV